MSTTHLHRRPRLSAVAFGLAVVVGVCVVSSRSAVGEAPGVLDAHRNRVVAEVPAGTMTQVEAEIGQGPVLSGPAPGSSTTVTIDSGGRSRQAIVSVPVDYSPGSPVPVLLAYPGYQQTASEMQKFAALDDMPAVVVYMQGVQDAWEGAPYAVTSDGEDLQFTRDMLAALNSTYNIDRSRIYATGMSNGGGFAAKLACRMPDVFAAVASVSAAYYPGTGGDCVTPSTSFLDIHGVQDSTIAYEGGSRHGETYQSARGRTEEMAERDGCSLDPVTTALADDVRRMQWTMCSGDRDVVHLRVEDGGHTWPGDDTGASGGADGPASDAAEATSFSLDASTEVWAFVSAHRLAAR